MEGLRRGRLPLAAAVAALVLLGATLPPLADLRGHWSEAPVTALALRGLVEGFPDGTFRPADPLSRAQVAKLLALATGQEEDARRAETGASSFTDMRGHWALGYVEVLAELGLMKGYPDGTFRPEGQVSRVELILLAARAAGIPPSANRSALVGFADAADVPAWAAAEVTAAAEAGLLRDVFPDGTLGPRRPASRAEAAALIARVESWRGTLHHLVGTVTTWNPDDRLLTVVTPAGHRVAVPTLPTTRFFRSGVAVEDLRPQDQAWIMLDSQGNAVFVETRYRDLLGSFPQVRSGGIRFLSLRHGTYIDLDVAPTAPVFVNGVAATLADVADAKRVYVVLDDATARVRLVDAVRYTHFGTVEKYDQQTRTLLLLEQPSLRAVNLRLGTNVTIFVDGKRANPRDLPIGAAVMAFEQNGRVTYLQTDR